MDIDAAVAAKQSNVVAITLAAQPFICSPCPPSLGLLFCSSLQPADVQTAPMAAPSAAAAALDRLDRWEGEGNGGRGSVCVCVDCEDVLPGINLHLMLNKAALHVQARRKKNV